METSEKTVSTNRKAYADFDILEKYEAGVLLTGSEVKSVREGKVNLKDSYALVKQEEALLFNCHISPYNFAHQFNHEPTRTRKLLLHKKEIARIDSFVKAKGMILVPTKIYFNNRGMVKVEIALGKGKKLYDKREDIKSKEIKRGIQRTLKQKKG